jgi:2-polyprenyl-3-methyl-5-hydroxy-6-metoxy-1,4-benzoquinol methylase
MNPVTQEPNRAHILWDARKAFPKILGTFDTVILGDILEHMTRRDQAKTILQSRKVLNPEGRLIITCPFDRRSPAEQHQSATGHEEYTAHVGAFHANRIRRQDLVRYALESGLRVELEQVIDYNFADGIGLVLRQS